jgi:hypothetical protein
LRRIREPGHSSLPVGMSFSRSRNSDKMCVVVQIGVEAVEVGCWYLSLSSCWLPLHFVNHLLDLHSFRSIFRSSICNYGFRRCGYCSSRGRRGCALARCDHLACAELDHLLHAGGRASLAEGVWTRRFLHAGWYRKFIITLAI